MTKAKTKAQRRRRPKHAGMTMPMGEVAAPRTTQGSRKPPEDAARAALEARCRAFGVSPTPDAMKALSAPPMGCDVGRCIVAIIGADWRPLWDTWQALSAARANYAMRILGTTANPQGSAIAMQSDALQADPGLTVDLRTADERDAAAIRADAYWTDLLTRLPTPMHRWCLRQGLGEGELWRAGEPTGKGRLAVASLVMLTAWRTTG